jgi:indolepyruvate ferredoxin oxidoreductase
LKFLRGTPLDPFGHTEERRMERELVREYEQTIEVLLAALSAQNHDLAVQIASLPEEMRGFGHIKKRNVEAARAKRKELLGRFSARAAERAAA